MKSGEIMWDGKNGGRISASGSGERCARTTAKAVMLGTSLLTITPAPVPIGGARMVIAGISDDKQRLCFALALWNGKDPILKERLFGLTNSEGNHGEDVKEYYFYLDSTPTHSYMKYLYKYPQAAYPYGDLVQTNGRRSRNESEYELLDTGVFNDNRYFDVFVEYAKAGPEDILIRITAVNRGPDAAPLHLLPTLWFRNDWSAWIAESSRAAEKPNLKQIKARQAQALSRQRIGCWVNSSFPAKARCRCFSPRTKQTTNGFSPGKRTRAPASRTALTTAWYRAIVAAVNPEKQGTKVAAHYQFNIGAGRPQSDSPAALQKFCRPDGNTLWKEF